MHSNSVDCHAACDAAYLTALLALSPPSAKPVKKGGFAEGFVLLGNSRWPERAAIPDHTTAATENSGISRYRAAAAHAGADAAEARRALQTEQGNCGGAVRLQGLHRRRAPVGPPGAPAPPKLIWPQRTEKPVLLWSSMEHGARRCISHKLPAIVVWL